MSSKIRNIGKYIATVLFPTYKQSSKVPRPTDRQYTRGALRRGGDGLEYRETHIL